MLETSPPFLFFLISSKFGKSSVQIIADRFVFIFFNRQFVCNNKKNAKTNIKREIFDLNEARGERAQLEIELEKNEAELPNNQHIDKE